MVRFFVSPEELDCERVVLAGENYAHAKVLRIKVGELVTVCDGQGMECLCTVDQVGSADISLLINERNESFSEPTVNVSVYMAFPKGDKFEHVVQKATELGAYEIIAFPSSRCVSKPDTKSLQKKLDRWQKIAAAAAEQSGRGRIPQVVVLNNYSEALNRASKADISILFYEHEKANTLHATLKSGYRSVSLLTGPEGGLELIEVQHAIEAGINVCTLGKRILRCETAPLCALSAVMYDSGEF